MPEPVIVSACRTGIGKFGKTLLGVPAPRLGAVVVEEAVKRAGIKSRTVEEVIMGNVISAGLGQNPARQAAMFAGIPASVGSFTVNKVCGSGLKAVMLAAQAIKAGDADVVVAGGFENMSNSPYLIGNLRWGRRYGDSTMVDAMIRDGLWEVYNGYHMGVTGETVAERHRVTRRQADEFAYESHMKAARAAEEGRFDEEMVGVEWPDSPGTGPFMTDECVRGDTSMEKLGRLKPSFKEGGILTAGNSSPLSDGAAAVVVMSEEKAEALGVEPMARIVGYSTGGVDPKYVMEAPIPTVRSLLKKVGMSMDEVDLVEHNEAYATASIVVRQELEVPEKRFNVNGGAVALGHPLGASGARILTTLIYSLRRSGKKTGVATLCLGGGNAVAMMIRTP